MCRFSSTSGSADGRVNLVLSEKMHNVLPLVGCSGLLAGLLTRSSQPVQRLPFLVRNSEYKRKVVVVLKGDDIWKTLDGGLLDHG